MLVQIQFTTFGSSTVFGNFGPGDRAWVKPDMARHLVEEAQCARHVEQASAQEKSAPQAPATPVATETAQAGKRRGRRPSST